MWCDHCETQYDVSPTAGDGRAACPECGEVLGSPRATDAESIRLFENLSDDAFSGIEFDEDWSRHDQAVRLDQAHPVTLFSRETRSPLGLDEPTPSRRKSVESRGSHHAARFLGLVFGNLGILCLMLGAGLLWYSSLEARPELVRSGWMSVMAGQIGLLLGWGILAGAGSREPDHEVLRHLNHMSDRLSVLEVNSDANNPAAHSFYNHLAAGAPSQMLLADLKGQLDLLAMRLHRQ